MKSARGVRVALGVIACFGLGAVLLGGTRTAEAIGVTTDAWDVSKGATVTAWGPALAGTFSSSITDMFGTNATWPEPGTTLFGDFPSGQVGGTPLPIGTIHWVEWRTPQAITLGGFNLFASCDGPTSPNRSFSHFRLEAKKNAGDAWTILYDSNISPFPYAPGNNPLISRMLSTPFASQYFRAEFTQGSAVQWASGPRVQELDAIVVPEPLSLISGAMGLAFFGGYLRKRRA